MYYDNSWLHKSAEFKNTELEMHESFSILYF